MCWEHSFGGKIRAPHLLTGSEAPLRVFLLGPVRMRCKCVPLYEISIKKAGNNKENMFLQDIPEDIILSIVVVTRKLLVVQKFHSFIFTKY